MRITLHVVDVVIRGPGATIQRRVAVVASSAEHAVEVARARELTPMFDLLGYNPERRAEHAEVTHLYDGGDVVQISETVSETPRMEPHAPRAGHG